MVNINLHLVRFDIDIIIFVCRRYIGTVSDGLNGL